MSRGSSLFLFPPGKRGLHSTKPLRLFDNIELESFYQITMIKVIEFIFYS